MSTHGRFIRNLLGSFKHPVLTWAHKCIRFRKRVTDDNTREITTLDLHARLDTDTDLPHRFALLVLSKFSFSPGHTTCTVMVTLQHELPARPNQWFMFPYR